MELKLRAQEPMFAIQSLGGKARGVTAASSPAIARLSQGDDNEHHIVNRHSGESATIPTQSGV